MIAEVPVLPPAISGASSLEAPPFLFKAGTASQAVKEADERLQCKVSGAVWVKKLTTDKQTEKKRAKTADLTEEKPSKKQKSAPSAKAKAKAKGSGKAKAKAAAVPNLQAGETEETLQSEIQYEVWANEEKPSGVRSRMWLDDMISAIMAVLRTSAGNSEVLVDSHGSSQKARLISMAVSYGLQFALEGKIKLRKKVFKEWSKFRPQLQNLLKQGLERLETSEKSALPSSSSVSDLLQHLVEEVGGSREDASSQLVSLTAPSTVQAAVQVAKGIVNEKTALSRVQSFVSKNNSEHVAQHLAYTAALTAVRESCCSCSEDSENKLCSFHHEEHTLGDFLWGVAKCFDMLDSVVPGDLLVVGAASMVLTIGVAAALRNKKMDAAAANKERHGNIGNIACSIACMLFT